MCDIVVATERIYGRKNTLQEGINGLVLSGFHLFLTDFAIFWREIVDTELGSGSILYTVYRIEFC